MMLFYAHFHFIRPIFLLALLPALIFLYLFWKKPKVSNPWQEVIEAPLLEDLLDKQPSSRLKASLVLLALVLLLTIFALAGPSWKNIQAPVWKNKNAVVLLVNLGESLNVQDLEPSRLVRVKRKLYDFLTLRQGGVTGLVVYAGSAFTVVPLTQDTKTIANMLPALSPAIMPKKGNNPLSAIKLARSLVENATGGSGDFVLITNSVPATQVQPILNALTRNIQLSVLGVGTTAGGPVPLAEGYRKNSVGDILLSKLRPKLLQKLADRARGVFVSLTLDNVDLTSILANIKLRKTEKSKFRLPRWQDSGIYMLPLLLVLVALLFRRNCLLSIFMCAFLFLASDSQARASKNLWLNDNQLGQKFLKENRPALAARTFKNPKWQAQAYDESGSYEKEAQILSAIDDPYSQYNRANSLVRIGQYAKALKVYEQVLKQKPGFRAAKYNYDLVKRYLHQEKKASAARQAKKNTQKPQQSPRSEQHSGNTGESNSKDQHNRQKSHSKNPPTVQQTTKSPKNNPQKGKVAESVQGQPHGAQIHPLARQGQIQPASKEKQVKGSSKNSKLDGDTEEQQALKNLLRQIPDDPGALLREKFYQQQLKRDRGA